ncbi:hypothetical protein [Aquimarina hainanensis]|uniref:hypothetical protein n=1 Tax=Aquimarina hainanensis TaxID=1578017 RepID=UPI00360C8ED3
MRKLNDVHDIRCYCCFFNTSVKVVTVAEYILMQPIEMRREAYVNLWRIVRTLGWFFNMEKSNEKSELVLVYPSFFITLDSQ